MAYTLASTVSIQLAAQWLCSPETWRISLPSNNPKRLLVRADESWHQKQKGKTHVRSSFGLWLDLYWSVLEISLRKWDWARKKKYLSGIPGSGSLIVNFLSFTLFNSLIRKYPLQVFELRIIWSYVPEIKYAAKLTETELIRLMLRQEMQVEVLLMLYYKK